MGFLYWLCVSLIFCFPLFKNPISMAAMVVVISLAVVSMLSLFSSFWFSYVLFLVYVGGLLVMFIYICLVSSNYPFKFSTIGFVLTLLGSCIVSMKMNGVVSSKFLGSGSWVNGESLLETSNISIFLFLAVLLLMMLLVVVRISGAGCFTVGSSGEKS
uniref:NADH dehydrogenase subunit 6 n=1 Tax=Tyrannodoris europaea TaxID=189538 RepID=Q8HKB6_TYREU|nr:NADH dehydrogenase subunit 6 [Tyrannodoris europaea]AAL91065.1 NADH dehydrogenase subunit 6 [Tyrannodoris europaea]